MEFQTPKETILKGIQVVQNTAAGRTTLPILNNILIKTQGNRLQLVATDLEIGIICEVAGQILREGSITVPAKRFGDIVRELPDGEVSMEAKKNNIVNIKSKDCLFKIIGLAEDEFPQFPKFGKEENITLDQGKMKQLLLMTASAISYDQTRHVLNGVLFAVQPEQIEAVATDGRRLSLFVLPNARPEPRLTKNVIVPAKAVVELIKNLKEEGEVKIGFKKNQILFAFNEITLMSRLIEGDYPDYEQVIPGETKEKLRVDRETLLQALKRAALLTSADSPAVVLELLKNRLVVSKTTPEIGEAREEITAEYGGGEFKVRFNPTFLADGLKNLDCQTVELELPAADKPGVIRDRKQFVYVVLPIEMV